MNLPNKITTFRMVCVIIIDFILLFPWKACGVEMPLVFNYIPLQFFISAILFLVASFSDFLDGYLARKYHLVTTYGKFMDPIADKLLVNSLLIIYALPFSADGFGFLGKTGVPLICVVLMIARDIIVDAIRMISVEKNVVIAASWFGKIKTVLQMVAIILVLLNNWPFVYLNWTVNVTNIIVGLATIVSVASGIDYLVKSKSLFAGDK